MTLRDLRDTIKPAPPLAPDDTVAKAIRLLRARGLPALPVADGPRLVGLVHEAHLIRLVADLSDPRAAAHSLPVAQVMRPIQPMVTEDQPLSDVARIFSETDAAALPVTASDGRYLGLLLGRDLLAAISGVPLAPPIAGLATPFGIYLTTGALRAGANDFALAATGAALMVINLLATAIIYGLLALADHFLPRAPAAAVLEPSPGLILAAFLFHYGLQVAVFLLLLRLSPLTRVHGAEHMVVHAIEEGEDLTPEKIRTMPRVHPRCGTNLMALLILLVIAQPLLASMGRAVDDVTRALALFVLVIVVLLTWRRLGAGLQRWVTTRRPSDRQLAQAVKVGKALLDDVQASPSARVSFRRRLWNSGFPQVLAGFLLAAALADLAAPLLTAAWSSLTGGSQLAVHALSSLALPPSAS